MQQMKKLIASSLLVLLIVTLFSVQSKAQQDAQYTQYMFNQMVLNPAYAGSKTGPSLTAIYRHQWAGFDGAPKTISGSFHTPFGQSGIGLFIESDQIGLHDRLTANISYAYHIPIGKAHWSLGVQGGLLNYSSNWTENQAFDPSDPNLASNESRLAPNFGLGTYIYGERFYLGFSVPHLLDSSLDNVSEVARRYKHYFGTAGVVIGMGPNLKLRPSVLVKAVPAVAPVEADLNLSLLIRDAFWVGAAYQTNDAVAFLLEYAPTKGGIKLGYSYDLTLTELAGVNNGSHEIMLGWDFGGTRGASGGSSSKGGEKILSPRYF